MREFCKVMIAEHLDLSGVIARSVAKMCEADSSQRIVVGPLGGKGRNGMVIGRQFDTEVIGIAHMQ